MTELHLLALTNDLVFSRICYQLLVEVGHDLVFGKLKNWKREAVFFIPEKPSVNISFQLGCSESLVSDCNRLLIRNCISSVMLLLVFFPRSIHRYAY